MWNQTTKITYFKAVEPNRFVFGFADYIFGFEVVTISKYENPVVKIKDLWGMKGGQEVVRTDIT